MTNGINKAALLLIDLQKGFDDHAYWGGERNNPNAEQQAAKLLQRWREANLPIFHIRHCSSNLASPLHVSNEGNAFKDEFVPWSNEFLINKNVNSAFIGTTLYAQLHTLHITKLVLVGLTTDHCISTSTRMAGNLGFEAYVVADATATFGRKGLHGEHYPAALIHNTALSSLQSEFATVANASEICSIFF
jgi:nicotinamidase-related amidase